jgi:nucleotide-binding universal stress UspA family protein
MYRRILAAVDGSEPSNVALRHAVRLAVEQGAQLRIVHVTQDPYWYFTAADGSIDVAAVERAWQENGKAILDAAAAIARAGGAEPEVALIERPGRRISEALVDEASHWGADLIVMGTNGRHGVEHLLLGSVAEGVMRVTTVPVLQLRAVRGGVEDHA